MAVTRLGLVTESVCGKLSDYQYPSWISNGVRVLEAKRLSNTRVGLLTEAG